MVRGQVEAEGQGHYRYLVYAKNVAGNAQANVASNKLKVKLGEAEPEGAGGEVMRPRRPPPLD